MNHKVKAFTGVYDIDKNGKIEGYFNKGTLGCYIRNDLCNRSYNIIEETVVKPLQKRDKNWLELYECDIVKLPKPEKYYSIHHREGRTSINRSCNVELHMLGTTLVGYLCGDKDGSEGYIEISDELIRKSEFVTDLFSYRKK